MLYTLSFSLCFMFWCCSFEEKLCHLHIVQYSPIIFFLQLSNSSMLLQNDVSGKKDGYAVEEMTFALEEEVFQAPDIPDPSALKEINIPVESKNKESDKAEKKGEKKRKSSEKPAEKKVLFPFSMSFQNFFLSLHCLV